MIYQPSRLELPTSKRSVTLRFVPPAYELTLRDENDRVFEKATVTGGQLQQVSLDMRPVAIGPIRLTYAARHILVEIDGKLFARVLDVDFIRLHHAASVGGGETVTVGESFDLR